MLRCVPGTRPGLRVGPDLQGTSVRETLLLLLPPTASGLSLRFWKEREWNEVEEDWACIVWLRQVTDRLVSS